MTIFPTWYDPKEVLSLNDLIMIANSEDGNIPVLATLNALKILMALWYTAEDILNKSTDILADWSSDTKYTSAKAVKDYVDTVATGTMKYIGDYNASVGTFPATGGSGTGWAIKKWDFWIISVAWTLWGKAIQVWDFIICNTSTPGQTASKWDMLNTNITYVPEDVANKATTMTGNTASNTLYLTAKAIYDRAVWLFATKDNPTFTTWITTPALKVTGWTPWVWKIWTSDADGDWSWETPSAWGSALWTAITATRTANKTCTVVGDQTAIFKKGMVIRWKESSVDRMAFVCCPSTFSTTTTITFAWDDMASIDSSSFKYMAIDVQIINFAYAGAIWSQCSDAMNAWLANEPYRVLGADLSVGTAGTTNNTTIDINKWWTTMFTTKPTLATTVASSPLPFTADTTTALALNDKVTIDIDAVQTTVAQDLYVKLYVVPTRYLFIA